MPGLDIPVVHTTDALTWYTVKEHATDALLLAESFMTHTTDALLAVQNSGTHTIDALLQTIFSQTHTTNALLLASNFTQHTTNTLLQASFSRVQTTDALLIMQKSLSHTSDSLITSEMSSSQTADSLLFSENSNNHSSDSLLFSEESLNHGTDTFLGADGALIHSTSSLLLAEYSQNNTTDSLLAVEVNTVHSSDALIVEAIARIHSTDSLLAEDVVIGDRNQTIDSLLFQQSSFDHSSNSRLVKPLSFTTNALLLGVYSGFGSLEFSNLSLDGIGIRQNVAIVDIEFPQFKIAGAGAFYITFPIERFIAPIYFYNRRWLELKYEWGSEETPSQDCVGCGCTQPNDHAISATVSKYSISAAAPKPVKKPQDAVRIEPEAPRTSKPFNAIQRIPTKDPEPGTINIVADTPNPVDYRSIIQDAEIAVEVKIESKPSINKAMLKKPLNQKSSLVKDTLITQVLKRQKRQLKHGNDYF